MPDIAIQDVKSAVRQLADTLPDDATWDDVMYRVYVRQAVDAGLRDVAEGRLVDVAEVPPSIRAIGMNVRWTHTAIGHLASIYEYISQDSPRYARRMVDRITARSRQIARFPRSGQMVPEYQDPDIREIIEGSYRVVYEAAANEVRVLAVIHGARLLPSQPPRDAST